MKTILKFSLLPLLLHALTGHATLTVTHIAPGCEAEHSLFLTSDGSLWAMGENVSGQLGDGNSFNFWTNRPEQNVAGGVTAIAVGDAHSLFLKSDGSLWAMGANGNGELGDGTISLLGVHQPEQIMASGVTAVAAGGSYSLFLKSDGSLWAMGYNNFGVLGDGTSNLKTNLPEQIVAGGVTAIAAGGYHALFLKADGSLWGMGHNNHGQLGDGRFSDTNQPEEIVPSGVTAIAAGDGHSLFLKSDGSLWAMGWNSLGQLGDGTVNDTNWPEQIVTNGVMAIAAGGQHSLFLKSDGSLWAMGFSGDGQLGDGTFNLDTNRPEQIVSGGVTAIAAGFYHSLFLKSDGSLWAMGNDTYGQLGDGFPSSNSAFPEQIFPSPQPLVSIALSSATNMQFKATTGFGGNFTLLAGTNIATPLSQWLPLRTNSITARGTNNYSVTVTNALNPGGGQFYILQSP